MRMTQAARYKTQFGVALVLRRGSLSYWRMSYWQIPLLSFILNVFGCRFSLVIVLADLPFLANLPFC